VTQTIRVQQLLRETIPGPYSDLVTRPTGRAVRTSIKQALVADPGAVALLDFSDVGLVDFSCADEVIAQLLLNPPTGATIVLRGLRDEQLEAIEHVLEHHAIAALVQDHESGEARMVGRVSPDLRTAFFMLISAGPCTALVLAGQLEWEVAHTETTLQTLARLRLVRTDGDRYLVPLMTGPNSP
jgi:hypothetical protein